MIINNIESFIVSDCGANVRFDKWLTNFACQCFSNWTTFKDICSFYSKKDRNTEGVRIEKIDVLLRRCLYEKTKRIITQGNKNTVLIE